MRLSEPARRFTAVAALVATLIVVQFALLLGGGLAANRASSRALDDMFTYVADISTERVIGFVRAAEDAVSMEAPQFANDQSSLGVMADFYATLLNRPELESLAVTYPNGEYVKLARSTQGPGGFSGHVIDVRQSGTVAHRFSEYDRNLRLTSEHHNIVTLDPREAEPYRQALAHSRLVWTKPYVDPGTEEGQVAVVEAVRDRDGNVRAVVTATILLDDLSDLLNSLPAGTDGEVFLLGADRTLITVSERRKADYDAYLAANGTLPRPIDLGLATSQRASTRGWDVIGKSGESTTLERGLDSLGVPWVIQLRASEGGLNEGFASVRATMKWVIGATIALTAILTYLLALVWRPMVRAHRFAVRDPLTGLYNRRHADKAAERMLGTAHRRDNRLAVAMFDLDNFKSLNDSLGHQAGDEALAHISRVLMSEIRATDMAVRWGGDEFLVALMVQPGEQPGTSIEQIRHRVQTALTEAFTSECGLGVTAGYCVSTAVTDNVHTLIACADAALVDGKTRAKGRTYRGRLPQETPADG